jgi:mRNA interferase MazF
VTVGDIHWVELPLSTGHEQSGRRPAVIVQDEAYAGMLPVVLTIPLTSAASTLRFSGTLLIQPNAENGLRQASVALVFQMRAVDRRRIGDRVGAVGAKVLAEIFTVLDKLLGRLETNQQSGDQQSAQGEESPSL